MHCTTQGKSTAVAGLASCKWYKTLSSKAGARVGKQSSNSSCCKRGWVAIIGDSRYGNRYETDTVWWIMRACQYAISHHPSSSSYDVVFLYLVLANISSCLSSFVDVVRPFFLLLGVFLFYSTVWRTYRYVRVRSWFSSLWEWMGTQVRVSRETFCPPGPPRPPSTHSGLITPIEFESGLVKVA